MSEPNEKREIEQKILPYSFALSLLYLSIFGILAYYWARKARDHATNLEISTKVSIACFAVVIALQTSCETI